MMKSIKMLSLAAVIGISGTFAAQAATFDFETLAQGNEGTWDAKVGAPGLTVDGVTVKATADVAGGAEAWAYLDSGTAGLGVCSVGILNGACDPSNDDNVGVSGDGGPIEHLFLEFSEKMSLFSLVLRDANHLLFNGGDEILITNLTTGFSDFFAVGGSDLLDWGFGTDWQFEVATGDGHPSKEFYISSVTVSPVPLPAGGLMLLAALGGLTAARRRRKAA